MLDRVREAGGEDIREVVLIAVRDQVADDRRAIAVLTEAVGDVQQRYVQARIGLVLRVLWQQGIILCGAALRVDLLDLLRGRTPTVLYSGEVPGALDGGTGAVHHLAHALAQIEWLRCTRLCWLGVPDVIAHQVAVDAVIGEQLHQIHILRRHLLRSITRNVRWAGTGHPHALGRWVGQDVVHNLLRPGTAGRVIRAVELRDVRVNRAAHLQDRHELHALAAAHLVECRDELLGVGTTDHVHRPLGVQITVGALLL